MAICHAEASRIGVRSHSGLRLEWARYPTAKWLACAGASMRFGSLIWNNQTALAKAATEHPAQTRRAPAQVCSEVPRQRYVDDRPELSGQARLFCRGVVARGFQVVWL